MIWLNGTLRPSEGAFSADDRGLLLGEAVFETVLLKNGVAQFWDAHFDRLMASCAYAGLETPYDSAHLQRAVTELAQEHDPEARQVLRITVTGGAGGRGLIVSQKVSPNWMLQLSAAPAPVELWHLVDVPFIRDAHHITHKTTAYLDNILMRRAAIQAGGDEAILFNAHGDVACGAAGNLFIGYNNRILTPRLQDGALPGIIRQQILNLESIRVDGHHWQISDAAISRETAIEAQFILLTNSVMEVVACAYNPPETRGTSKQQAQKMAVHLNDALPCFRT